MLSPFIIAVIAVVVILVILWAAGVFKKKQPNALRLRQNFREKSAIGWIGNNYSPTDANYTKDFWGTNYPQITQVTEVGGLNMLGAGLDLRANNLQDPTQWVLLGPMKTLPSLIVDNGECISWNPQNYIKITNEYSKNSDETKSTLANNFGVSGSFLNNAISMNMTASKNTDQSGTTDGSSYFTNVYSQTGGLMLNSDRPASGNSYCTTDNVNSQVFLTLFNKLTGEGGIGALFPNIWFFDGNWGNSPLNNGVALNGLFDVLTEFGTHIITEINIGTKYSLLTSSSQSTTISESDYELNMCLSLSPASTLHIPPIVCPSKNKCVAACPTGQTCDPQTGLCGPATITVVRGVRRNLKDEPVCPDPCPISYESCDTYYGKCTLDADLCDTDPTCTGQCVEDCAAALAKQEADAVFCEKSFDLTACDNYTESDYQKATNLVVKNTGAVFYNTADDIRTEVLQKINTPDQINPQTMVTFLNNAKDPKNVVAIGYVFTPIWDVLQAAVEAIFARNPPNSATPYESDQTDYIRAWMLQPLSGVGGTQLHWWTQAITLLKLAYVKEMACPATPTVSLNDGTTVNWSWLDCDWDTTSKKCAGDPSGDTPFAGAGYHCYTRVGSGCTNLAGGENCHYSHAGCTNNGNAAMGQSPSAYTCTAVGTPQQTPTTYAVGYPNGCDPNDPNNCSYDDGCGWANWSHTSCECDQDAGSTAAIIWKSDGSMDCV